MEKLGISNLIETVLSRLSLFKSDIILVENAEKSYDQLVQYPRLRFAVDIFPDKGPLSGIYTGLAASTTKYNLVVACDMPFLNLELLDYMVRVADNFDAAVPRLGKLVEPLHAIYSKNCLHHIKDLIERNELQVFQLFAGLDVRYIDIDEINRFDPKHLSFFNIDTEADLKKAKELIKTEKK